MLVGLMIDPTEPNRLYPFLEPRVDELLKLCSGVFFNLGIVCSFTLRTALLCLYCINKKTLCFISYIPDTRKVCGFPGINAQFVCSKCLKEFSCERFGDRTDSSGYDRNNWTLRSTEHHKCSLELMKNASTATERQKLQ